jgi:hypothetical protein
VSLTRELYDRTSAVARYLRVRFPHVRGLQRRYREPIADVVPLLPEDGIPVPYGIVGAAFDWRLRFLLTPSPTYTSPSRVPSNWLFVMKRGEAPLTAP